MALDMITYALAKKYTDNSMQGGGAVAGKNCVITSITPITGGNRVEFQWTLDDGTVQTDTMDVMDGAKGETGAQGPKGDTGATGPQGIQGIQGTAGAQGIQGPKGDTGATGAQGLQGIQGPKGDKGDDGYPFLIYKQYDNISEFDEDDFPEIGLMFMVMVFEEDKGYPIYRYTGEGEPPYSRVTYMNTEGIKGDKGDKGDTGAQGIQGEKGDKGDKGDQGDQGIQGPKGDTGDQGPTGATGAKGDKGDKGDAGEGVPEGGTAGQVLKKKSNTDYDTEWGEAASPLTFDTDDFDVSAQNAVSLDARQRIFTGTTAEWTALSAADKAKYTLVSLTDDGETINDIFVIVHAGVNEVVTIDNTHNITMNSKGEAIASLSPGMHTLAGSLSEKTFEVIVNGNTTDIYCMPNNGEGILYWFGAELTPLMFNRDTYGGNLTRDTNRLIISKYTATGSNNSMLTPTYKINLNNYSKINTIIQYGDTASYYQHLGYGAVSMSDPWPNSTQIIPSTTKQEASYNFANGIGEQYCGYETNGYPNGTYIYALWLDPR